MKVVNILLAVLALFSHPALFAQTESEKAATRFWYDGPRGEKIEFEPLVGEVLVEFSPQATSSFKAGLISTGNKTARKALAENTTFQEWSLDDEVIPVQAHWESPEIVVLAAQNSEVLGVLPRLKNKSTGEIVDFRPATFDIAFSQTIREADILAFLEKHNLTLRSDPVKNFYSYHVLRVIHVEIPRGQMLFDVIRAVRQAPEVEYAFPLFRNGRTRLKYLMGLLSARLWTDEPEYFDKMDTRCRELYRLSQNASQEVLSLYQKKLNLNIVDHSIEVEFWSLDGPEKIQSDLAVIDFHLQSQNQIGQRFVLNGWLPLESLDDCAKLNAVTTIQIIQEINSQPSPTLPTGSHAQISTSGGGKANSASANSVITEGFNIMKAQAWHDKGFKGKRSDNGQPIKIGIIDVGFADWTSKLGTELPNSTTWQKFHGSAASSESHGTACAEIIHDLAPEAYLYLAEIQSSGTSFNNALNWLQGNNVDIVSISLAFYDAGPGNGAGTINDAINFESAMFFAVGAGNEGLTHYEAQFNGDGRTGGYDPNTGLPIYGEDEWHNFTYEDDDITFEKTTSGATTLNISLKWYDPYSFGEWYNTSENLDLFLAEGPDEEHLAEGDVILCSVVIQNGTGRTEDFSRERLLNVDIQSGRKYHIFVKDEPLDPLHNANRYQIEVFTFPYQSDLHWESDPGIIVSNGSLPTPADNSNVCTVAGFDAATWNGSSGSKLSYNSRGPDNSLSIQKPDVFGPSRVSTSVYGTRAFAGTSAAAPHLAGAAALIKSAYPNYNRNQIRAELCKGQPGYSTAGFLVLPPPPINTGVEDYVEIYQGPTVVDQNNTVYYQARFVDTNSDGDYVQEWRWKLMAWHEEGQKELVSTVMAGGPNSTAATWFVQIPDLNTWSGAWVYDANGQVPGQIVLEVTDNDLVVHSHEFDIVINHKPGQPAIQQTQAGNGYVTLTFTSRGATQHEIYYDTDSGVPYQGSGATQGASPIILASDPMSADPVTFTVTGFTNGTTYYFAIKAENSSGETNYSNEVSATPNFFAPPTPENLAIALDAGGFVKLTWQENDGPTNLATGYKILRSTTSGSGFSEIAEIHIESYTDYTVAPNVTYFYKVYAFNAAGNSANTPEVSALADLCGNLSSNVIWSTPGAILACTVTVPSGSTLTIEPGCNVIAASGAVLDIYGTLDVQGNSSAPVLFDRSGSSGTWYGIKFRTNSSGTVSYATLDHAQKGLHIINTNNVTATQCTIRNFTEQGVHLNGAGGIIQNCTITLPAGASHGIQILGTGNPSILNNVIDGTPYGIGRGNADALGTISGNNVSNCANAGIRAYSSSPNIFNNTVQSCGRGIEATGSSSTAVPDIHDNAISSCEVGVYIGQVQPLRLKWNDLGPNMDWNLELNTLASNNAWLDNQQNNFYGGGSYQVVNYTATVLNARSNYWTGTNSIGFAQGPIDATQPLTNPNPDAGPGGQTGKEISLNERPSTNPPDNFAMSQSYPNPLSASTGFASGAHIRFDLPEPAKVEVKIYDLRG